ncbi:ATP synthase F1 subunit epsilon [Fusobacterium canifelinum]|uniref:ATP synthase epsilon chain n=1 Tax=Fusobacterium canifelinum TaxID=285729 RepID=A0A3P1UT34_9FUSO|nr:ATP synthase F1 subunit epsilon [Fusobacterium canifelinum]QQB74917.1 ATP synthase F1 subunit epsilon [Fusobacterium canifelinum]QQS88435.1 ATP synthase F1 subunit epsilon [Fusobacterium canifelinum]RRD24366.1 ATP synthase F1 subunit epsilon [Fusobacterium canifelinum]
MPSFNVSVVTQVKKILEQEAGYLRLRTSEGDIGILPNHAPFVAELSMGKMEIESPNKDRRDVYFLSGGFLEISDNQATVIADEIFPIEEINIENEETLVENLKKELEKVSNEEEKKKLQKKIKISLAKIDAINN